MTDWSWLWYVIVLFVVFLVAAAIAACCVGGFAWIAFAFTNGSSPAPPSATGASGTLSLSSASFFHSIFSGNNGNSAASAVSATAALRNGPSRSFLIPGQAQMPTVGGRIGSTDARQRQTAMATTKKSTMMTTATPASAPVGPSPAISTIATDTVTATMTTTKRSTSPTTKTSMVATATTPPPFAHKQTPGYFHMIYFATSPPLLHREQTLKDLRDIWKQHRKDETLSWLMTQQIDAVRTELRRIARLAQTRRDILVLVVLEHESLFGIVQETLVQAHNNMSLSSASHNVQWLVAILSLNTTLTDLNTLQQKILAEHNVAMTNMNIVLLPDTTLLEKWTHPQTTNVERAAYWVPQPKMLPSSSQPQYSDSSVLIPDIIM